MVNPYNHLKNSLEISHGSNPTFKSIEGLRGIAVVLVFLVHYTSLTHQWHPEYLEDIASAITQFGHLGVDLFFVLSGFLIYKSIMTKDNFSPIAYVKRRARRIYPVFLIVLAIYLLLSLIFTSESKLPESGVLLYILQNIFLLPGIFFIEPIITVAWSLSYEALYYFMIPFLIFGLKLKQWRVNHRIIVWSAVSVIYLALCNNLEWREVWGHRSHLVMFIAGIILFEIHNVKGITVTRYGTICFLLALLLNASRQYVSINNAFIIAIIYVLFFFFCLCAFNTMSIAYRWLTITPLRWLGNISYSYYLIHGLTLKAFFLACSSLVPPGYTSASIYPALLLPSFISTLVVAYVLFIFVERPYSLQQTQ